MSDMLRHRAHHKWFTVGVCGSGAVICVANLVEAEAALRPVLAEERHVGPVDDHPNGPILL